MLEVSVVDVRVHSEQPLEDNLDDVEEVLGEGHTNCTREDLLVIQLVLYPGHQEVNVLLRRDLQRRLYIMTVCPEILILGSSRHSGTGFGSTELCQNTIEYIYLVIELNCIDSEPLIEVLSSGQLNRKLHVATSECHPGNLFETVASRALLDLLLLLEGLGLVQTCQLVLRFLHFENCLYFKSRCL